MAWDWDLILTSTVISAIVSSSVSFFTSHLRLRFDRLKERRAEFFPHLMRLREQLQWKKPDDLKQVDTGIMVPKPSLESYLKEVALFEQFKFYLTRKDRINLENARVKFLKLQMEASTKDQSESDADRVPRFRIGADSIITGEMEKVMWEFVMGLRSATEAQTAWPKRIKVPF